MSNHAKLSAIVILGASTMAMAADLSTPQGALRALEDAYIRKDIEAAVPAKDFEFEARAMLAALKNLPKTDAELVNQAAEVLELSFRKEMKSSGFPNFAQLHCSVIGTKDLKPGLVELVEECIFPDGQKSRERVHAAKSRVGWRIVVLPQ